MPEWLGPAFIAVVVSALVTVAGWFATYRSTRRLEELRRQEKTLDVQTALIAEIRSNMLRFADTDLEALEREVVDRIGSAPKSSPYTPFIPKFAHAMIFETVMAELHVLPTETIEDVVSYYKIEYKLSAFADDIRGDAFASLSPERKKLIYSDYVHIIRHAQKTGHAALQALVSSLEGGRLNRKGGGRSRGYEG
jgi:hypothetical protein